MAASCMLVLLIKALISVCHLCDCHFLFPFQIQSSCSQNFSNFPTFHKVKSTVFWAVAPYSSETAKHIRET
jgi:hypothetical protein